MFARLELTEEATRHYFESAVLDGSKEEKEVRRAKAKARSASM
jgi:hypothetical protein